MSSFAGRAARSAHLATRHARLAASGRLPLVPMDQVTDEFAFGLGDRGWNPLVALIRELADLTPPGEVDYQRFFASGPVRAVATLDDVLFFHAPALADGLAALWLGTYPWGGLTPDAPLGSPFGHQYDAASGADTSRLWGEHMTPWYRPGDPDAVAMAYRRGGALYPAIKRRYSPWKARGFPQVCRLDRASGECRYVILDGHHRLACLAATGHRRVRVEVVQLVDERDVHRWANVVSGQCTVAQALRYFEAFFLLDGTERRLAAIGATSTEVSA